MKNKYDENYYENGVQLGISGYTNYRWIPQRTIPTCKNMAETLNIKENDILLDFGCAKGFIVKALNILGYNCYGVDVSEYAIKNADLQIRNKVFLYSDISIYRLILEKYKKEKFDLVISKDVFEHIPYNDIDSVIKEIRQITKRLFVVVPLAKNKEYVVPNYEADITHIIREDLFWWINKLESCGFEVLYSSYKMNGIKDNWSHYEKGNGFFICT